MVPECHIAVIFLSILNVSPNNLSICFLGNMSSCIIAHKSFFSYSIDIIFCPNLYVHVGLIAFFPISNSLHLFTLNSIFHVLLHSYILFMSFCNSSQSLWILIYLSNFALSANSLSKHSSVRAHLILACYVDR